MFYSGKKFRALRDRKNKYSNSRVVRKKNSERNKKPYPPPLQVKWSVPNRSVMGTFHNDEKKKAYRIEPVLISFLEKMLAKACHVCYML